MDFYNDLVTQKSWATLRDMKRRITFITIGGWAVWLYTKALKSKDIDIIVDYDQLEKLRGLYPLTKNDRLKKYEARNEEVAIDVYLPHYSAIGVPVEEVLKHTQTIDMFRVPDIATLVALKLFAYRERRHSAKGQKDRLDVLSLLLAQPVKNLPPVSGELAAMVKETTKIPELGVNEYAWSKKKKELLRVEKNHW